MALQILHSRQSGFESVDQCPETTLVSNWDIFGDGACEWSFKSNSTHSGIKVLPLKTNKQELTVSYTLEAS